MKKLVVIAHNLRSTHNVGSLLRTAEGIGVDRVYLTGYTPYPLEIDDKRLPHDSAKIARQINKTALGAEDSLNWQHSDDIIEVLKSLRDERFTIVALEQSNRSVRLPEYVPPDHLALIIGREVEGIETDILAECDDVVEIPMHGKKESFNVIQAAAMALYHFKFAGSVGKIT